RTGARHRGAYGQAAPLAHGQALVLGASLDASASPALAGTRISCHHLLVSARHDPRRARPAVTSTAPAPLTVSPEAYALDEMRLIFSGEPKHPMNTRPHIRFVVYGLPQPRGSKNAFVNRKTGKAIVTDDNPRSREW